jgi:hypothetical protein
MQANREEAEVESNPEGEREEIRQIYAAKGLSGDTLEEVVDVITSDKERWRNSWYRNPRRLSSLRGGFATSPLR